jgi:hypothetical protein
MRTIKLNIDGAGRKHCIATTLNEGCCPQLRTQRMGFEYVCGIWGELEGQDHRLIRRQECIEAEVLGG